MTDKEIRHLSRSDLLMLLIEAGEENDRLREELRQTQETLASREIRIANAGSIAQAALELNGVLEATQASCDQYLENIRRLQEETQLSCQRMREETEASCLALRQETRRLCDTLLTQAMQESQAYWDQVQSRVEEACAKTLDGEEE